MDSFSAESDRHLVNNSYYDGLLKNWYQVQDDPIALLRAETRTKLAWLGPRLPKISAEGLDVGCGGGFATNQLAQLGHQMTGLDFSEPSLKIAKEMDGTQSVNYIRGDAYSLPFKDSSFDFITCFDFLEHVSNPEKVIKECSRVLRPGGHFFYHTFNKNRLSWIIVIKGVEWFVKNTPKNLHVYSMFIKPETVRDLCRQQGLNVIEETGLRPVFNFDLLKMLWSGAVPPTFQFKLTSSRLVSYLGKAIKN